MASVHFTVPGIPAPKGSRIVGRRKNGSLYTRPASKNEKAWTQAVATVASAYRHKGVEAPYGVACVFYLPRPKKPAHDHPTRGDIDKFVRSTLDGLTEGGLIVDDRHVVGLSAEKRWADAEHPSGAVVVVAEA